MMSSVFFDPLENSYKLIFFTIFLVFFGCVSNDAAVETEMNTTNNTATATTVEDEPEINTVREVPTDIEWTLTYEDPGSDDWTENYFLDGELANVTRLEEGGLLFEAGEGYIDKHHAVLWTKESFEGDIKIEYDFTRADKSSEMEKEAVVILYVHATGLSPDYDEDISLWADERKIAAMPKYHSKMNAIHISYATHQLREDNYIRLKIYPKPKNKRFYMIGESYHPVDFLEDVTYHITFIKNGFNVFFVVEANGEKTVYTWNTSKREDVTNGRVGFRQMGPRKSIYDNLKIYTAN